MRRSGGDAETVTRLGYSETNQSRGGSSAVACPECGSVELDLVELLEDERRRVKCQSCGHEWLRGEPQQQRVGAKRTLRDPAEAKEPTVFVDDDDAYLEWTRTWPGGYVLNCERDPSTNYMMLHRAHCDTITEPGPQATTWTVNDYIKVCSTDRQELRTWARTKTGSPPPPVNGLCDLMRSNLALPQVYLPRRTRLLQIGR